MCGRDSLGLDGQGKWYLPWAHFEPSNSPFVPMFQYSWIPGTFPGAGAACPWDEVCLKRTHLYQFILTPIHRISRRNLHIRVSLMDFLDSRKFCYRANCSTREITVAITKVLWMKLEIKLRLIFSRMILIHLLGPQLAHKAAKRAEP